MNYRRLGSAYGREIFIGGSGAEGGAPPQGYSIAAVLLREGWKSDELGWLLNELYGALEDWTEFTSGAGVRSFMFYGERADEASSLCDTFAYAWTHGAESEYNGVIASTNEAQDIEQFVEAAIAGEIAAGDAYADKLQNVLFTAMAGEPPGEEDLARSTRLETAVQDAIERHRFD